MSVPDEVKNRRAEDYFRRRMQVWDPVALYSNNYGDGPFHERLTNILEYDLRQKERSASGPKAPMYRTQEAKHAERKLEEWVKFRDALEESPCDHPAQQ